MDPTVAKFVVRGLCSAPFTPCIPGSGAPDLDAIAAHAEALVKQGVFFAFVAGTTGEGVSFSVAERKAITEAWVAASRGRIGVIAHVGATSIADVRELSSHAAAAGAVALGVQPTTFFKPDGLGGVLDLLAETAAAAPALPL
jgi:N-acetylneuraminate lyase